MSNIQEIRVDDEVILQVLHDLEIRHNIICSSEGFEFGHVCKTVFRGKKADQSVVVKIGLTAEARREVLMNQAGYNEMRRIGAENYLPAPCEFIEFSDVPILVMGDCGENLFKLLQRSDDPDEIFKELASDGVLVKSTMKNKSRGGCRPGIYIQPGVYEPGT